jgi:hypothetical protein
MGLITGGHGQEYYSVVTAQQPLPGFAGNADNSSSAFVRKSSATESFLEVLNAAKLQLL